MAKTGIYIGNTPIHNVGVVIGDTYESTNAAKEQIQNKTGKTYGNLSEAIQDVLVPYGNNSIAVANVVKSDGTEIGYTSVYAALEAALYGETVIMITNSSEPCIVVPSGVTLDLNGKILNAPYFIGVNGSKVKDSTTCTARLVSDFVMLSKDNADPSTGANVPVKTDDGYIFVHRFKYQHSTSQPPQIGDETKLTFRPTVNTATNKFFADGMSDNGLSLIVRLTWLGGSTIRSQDFKFTDSTVSAVYNESTEDGNAFVYRVDGLGSLGGVDIGIVIKSDTGVEHCMQTYTLEAEANVENVSLFMLTNNQPLANSFVSPYIECSISNGEFIND